MSSREEANTVNIKPFEAKPSALRIALMAFVVVGSLTAGASAAPQVVSADPPSDTWIVDGRDTLEVTITFDTEVVVPVDGIQLFVPSMGRDATANVDPLGVPTTMVTVTAPTINERIMRIVANVSVVDADGVPLDGDGDGAAGGSAIFEYIVSTGDVTRDGAVDGDDLDAFVAALDTQDPNADLDGSGVVDGGDRDIILAGFGGSVAFPDGDAPMVTSVTAEFFGDTDPVVHVTFDEPMDPDAVHQYSIYGLLGADELLLASGAPTTGDDRVFTFPFAGLTCDRDFTIQVDRSSADGSGQMMGVAATRVIAGQDSDPPTLTCPEPLFVNSTTVYSIPAADVSNSATIQAYLASAEASDVCTPDAQLEWTTSLDTPHDLPLGVNDVTLSVMDQAGNEASCDTLIIVVPAVPLQGTPGSPGAEGAQGEQGAAGADGADGQDGADGASGADGAGGANGQNGADGADGIACWDLNQNGQADPVEDINGDSVVNVLDCQPAATDNTTGQPVPGGSSGGGALCGVLGMINLLWMFVGLGAMRYNGRRRRG